MTPTSAALGMEELKRGVDHLAVVHEEPSSASVGVGRTPDDVVAVHAVRRKRGTQGPLASGS
jgi:hypothetical protein